MKYPLEKLFSRILLSCLLALPIMMLSSTNVDAAEHCSDSYYIDETLPNGSRWDMCWEHRQREGIIFHHIYYTPKNEQRRLILNHAAVAQIHVPYDDNGARYHDISDYGIGGNNILSINSDECPGGNLLNFSGKNVLCKQIESRPLAHKNGNNVVSANNLSLFSVSPVGAYYYIPTWRFMDDGTIEPWIGATGALQRFGSNQSRGWKLGDNRVGIAHLHNFFWKLDFDLNGSHLDDVVEELNFPLVNNKRLRTITAFTTEAARKVNPDTMRHWRIKDKSLKNANDHSASFDILINETGHQDIGPASEPFTHNDFYVTKQKNEEKFASHNPSGASNLAEFANGESILNNDIVVWAGVTFYHMPRSEDAPHMNAHWSHIKIVPRDWHASNPLGTTPVNTPPTVTSPSNQSTQQGSSVSLSIQATDVDGDSLSYSATGLPNGIQINNNSGLISGNASIAGDYDTTITVSDGSDTSSVQFNWLISAVNTNTPPTISSPGNQTGLVGNNVNLTIQANDTDGDSLSYSASGLPNGLQINTTSGRISGSLNAAGNYSVTVTVSDSSVSANTSFNWVVTSPNNSTANEVSSSAITIDGNVNDWNGLDYFSDDPDDIDGENNQIDWLKIAIAHSPQNVFMTYKNRQNVDPNNNSGTYIPWGWEAYLDTDNNSNTGYKLGSIGADYVIDGYVIERYIGTGTSWSWDIVDNASLMYSGADVELSFPRSNIGNPQNMKVVFNGDNGAYNGDSTDRYPDSGYFSYTFSGSSSPNSAPIADNQQFTVGSSASVSLILTATDPDNDSISYSITHQPQHGSLSGSAPNLVYTADNDFTGDDSFIFIANDGELNSSSATIKITVTNGQENGAIANYVNSPITVDGNESDWSELSRFSNDANDASGNINWQNTALAHDTSKLYLLYKNWGNIDPFDSSGSYLAWGWQIFIDSDKNASTGFQLGAIGADYVLEGNHIQRYTGSGSNWSWSHIDSVESKYQANIAELALPLSQIGNPDSIRVGFRGDSSSYAGSGIDLYPDGLNNSQSSIRFFEYDITGGDSGSNGRPIAYTQSVSVNSGSNVSIALVGSDPNDDTLTYSVVANPTSGSLSGIAPNLTYTPDNNFIGQDNFTFNVSDGNVDSSNATVNINVSGAQSGTYSNPVSSISIDGNNEEWASLSAYTQDGNDIGGINNVIDWQRAATSHNGSDIYFMYESYNAINTDANNGSFINWGWQTFIDTDSNQNTGYQIGTVGAEYVIEGTQIQRYIGDGSSWSWDNFATATVSYNANTVELGFARSLIGNPNKLRVIFVGDNDAFGGSSIDTYPNALDYFEYQLSGGTTESSNRPDASSITLEVRASNTADITLSATDLDGDNLTYRLVVQPSNGTLSGSGQNYIYTPNADFIGEDSFRYIASDGTFDSSVETVVLNVSESGAGSGTGTGTGTGTGNSSSSGGGSLPFEWLMLFSFIGLLRFRIK
ncbi:Ig-like domain-containing protein [uncultured Cocleimonas sp.]|uniref:Ig-like domain-containing protein n=1 Tax=uncultured Cocleimonas sp. TaxID=1051587 RepID=UPI002631CE23|nr:Ig-like domain-containing protein [uncultured Cocleimonas sp.]